jgi:hypothetical protein
MAQDRDRTKKNRTGARQVEHPAPSLMEPPAEKAPSAILAWLERRHLPVSLLLILFASLRIVATYSVFNHTSDEPNHIACGMEWLDKGRYTYETQHPPLARVASALGPFLLGVRSQAAKVAHDTLAVPREGLAILYFGHRYDLTLTAARLGVLPFFWIACLVTYWWARRESGGAIAVIAVALFSFLPDVLAHAGLATTDMALTAFLGAAFVSSLIWLEQPTRRNSVIFGIFMGLAILSKFSAPIFLPAAWGCALLVYLSKQGFDPKSAVEGARRALPTAGIAVGVAFLIVWAGYRFSFGQFEPGSWGVPAPELFSGMHAVLEHNAKGHPTFFLGQRNRTGFWYFYPVLMAVKAPIGFLALFLIGLLMIWRERFRRAWAPLSLSAAILGVGIASQINIGMRHILPVYFGLSIVGAIGLAGVLEHARTQRLAAALGVVLTVWFAGVSLLSHPDYLPYFNEFAGSHPENIVVDSNLDWGQDTKRLAARLQQVGARGLTFNQFFLADLEKEHGFPPIHEMDLLNPSPGWNAVDLTNDKVARLGLWNSYPDVVPWPDRIPPQERVGKSILLWYFPETK